MEEEEEDEEMFAKSQYSGKNFSPSSGVILRIWRGSPFLLRDSRLRLGLAADACPSPSRKAMITGVRWVDFILMC